MRRATLDSTVKHTIENSRFYSFICMLFVIIFTPMLIRYREDVRNFYDKYPEPVIFMIVSVGLLALQLIISCYIAMQYTLECGLKTCKIQWTYHIILTAFNFWGASHVFSRKFEQLFMTLTTGELRIYDMITGISVLRFAQSVFLSISLMVASLNLCTVLTSKDKNAQIKSQK